MTEVNVLKKDDNKLENNIKPEDVIVEQAPEITQESLQGKFSYMRMEIQADAQGNKHHICLDTGTGRDMIDRRFLGHFEHTIHKLKGGAVKGFNGPSSRLEEYATFFFYMRGQKADGAQGMVKMQASAWLIDKLEANCLLGNTWLFPRGAQIDCQAGQVKFPHFAGGFIVTVEVVKPIRDEMWLGRLQQPQQ
jgi:hypothetical protein